MINLSLITVIDPRSYRRNRYTALEHRGCICCEYHASSKTTVTPAPYTNPIRIDPLILFQQSSEI